MARPRKNDPNAAARDRLIEAFWKLIEHNRLHEITVSMVTGTAHCSRNAFYYHFSNRDALVEAAIDQELEGVPHAIFMLLSSTEDTRQEHEDGSEIISHYLHALFPGKGNNGGAIHNQAPHRLALFMEQGGRDIVEKRVKGHILGMWATLLTPEGGKLQSEARMILEHGMSGMLGLIAHIGKAQGDETCFFPTAYIKDLSALMLDNICRIQNVDREQMLARMRMISSISEMQQ